MAILITGAYGFIGSQLAHQLLQTQEEELLLVDSFSNGRSRSCAQGLASVPFIDRDQFLDRLPRLTSIKIVFHLGACTDTGQTDENYLKKWNTDYTCTIFKWCTERQIPLIYASSAATYGSGEFGYSDDHARIFKLKPLNLYGQSKQDFDLWALQQPKTPPAWYGLKFFNVFGFDENHKGRMASTIYHGFHQIQTGKKMILFKSHRADIPDGQQKRDFIFIDDIVRLCCFFSKKRPASGIYNCGTGQARSFYDMALSLFKTLQVPVNIEWIPTPEKFRNGYQYFTQADMTKTRNVGFQDSFISLEEGIATYVQQLLKNKNKGYEK
jgi:ADP-L-glycero-D-manno-heptose 6-epimerase